uniref:Putative membrane protein n=1 Tax=Streptosporangium amethystogenes TaxID=2002 RepID=M4ZRT0_9ACTN|nr:putative membrane protein [Streptosporangium amethystogenes]
MTRWNETPSATGDARAFTGRALAPDLARGVMLLAISLAHAPLFVTRTDPGTVGGLLQTVFVLNHARPLFAFLFGYALVQLLRNQQERGSDWGSASRLLRRRGWWLTAFGLAHAAVLVPVDILAAYGLCSILLVGLLRRDDAALLWTAGLVLIPCTVVVGVGMYEPMTQNTSLFAVLSAAAGDASPWEMFVSRITRLPARTGLCLLLIIPGTALGMWAARRRILDDPAAHRPFLVRATIVTTALSVAGSLPAWLIESNLWPDPSRTAMIVAAGAQPLTGYFGGIGMAGLVALVALRAGRRHGPLTTAVQALGRRSLTFYLFQSVVFVAVFYPYGLDLQDDLGFAGAVVVAVTTWALSIVGADLMRRAGHRGPAEILLRRLAYR